jgi:lipid-A-disaccharide synthase
LRVTAKLYTIIMKYYLIAGEASGDLHGSNLVKELCRLDASATIRCWGGDKMEEAGAVLVKHYRELAFMGFIEVVKNLRTIFKNLAFCKQDIEAFKPDVLVLIDYPGFNLRIAKWARLQGLKIVYYISPQVWAWKENRVHAIKRDVDKMLVILPFEQSFYQKWHYPVEYVGHPLVQVINEFKPGPPLFKHKNIIALLPGSRKQEILKKLPLMLQVSKQFPQYHFVVAKAPGIDDDFYTALLAPYKNVSSVINKTYQLLTEASAALVTSGTATLETALFKVPEVVCYKSSNISYQIARRLIRIKYISLVNLIMDKEVVKELIQHQLTPANIGNQLQLLLTDEAHRQQLFAEYAQLKNLLGQGGNASANAAKSIVSFLNTAK